MIRPIFLIAVASIFLQACAQLPTGGKSSTNDETQTPQSTIPYLPGDREQFVFAEKLEILQEYGFDGFCTAESFACSNRLDYEKYVGMKGYFKTDEPSDTNFFGSQVWPVVLENGDGFYFVSKPKYGGKYGPISGIVSLGQYEQVASFSAEPLIPGSLILVESVKINYGKDIFTLSNGTKIERKELGFVRHVASQFPASQATIAEALLSFSIQYDEVENQYFALPKENKLGNEVNFYIGIKPDKTWLRMIVKYYGDDWLFVQSYKVSADSILWESPSLEFKRDHSSGSVWEWMEKSPTDEDLRNMRALATAENPIIRFQGRHYYKDFKLSGEQQDSITNSLELYELLRR